jgi:hypothetical protein
MTRRTFARLFGYTAGLACCLPILSGCNTATVATFVTTIAKYAAQLATYFSAGSLATQITALAATIAADIQAWQSGSAATNAINALNDLAALINQIPFLGAYSVFIDLILGAIAGLLALLPSAMTVKLNSSRPYTAIPYAGFDKKSMTNANTSFEAAWARYSATLPTTR